MRNVGIETKLPFVFPPVMCRYVRQGVLFAMSMLLVATPTLPSGLEGGLAETIHWVEGKIVAMFHDRKIVFEEGDIF